MSSDLLRRAAEVLLKHAEAASPGDWTAATHTGRMDGISLVGRVQERGHGTAIAVFAGADARQRAADARHVALMHPPVALALAAALEGWAESLDDAELTADEVALARAILREPGGDRD